MWCAHSPPAAGGCTTVPAMASVKDQTRRVVAYHGRGPAPAAEGVRTLDDAEALPSVLLPALDAADELFVSDPLSFPWEQLADRHWDLPMTVRLPAVLPLPQLLTLLDRPLMRHLTLFDRFVLDDWTMRIGLRNRYGWSRHQLSRADDLDGDAVLAVQARARTRAGGGPYPKALHRVRVRVLRSLTAAALRDQPTSRAFTVLVASDHVERWMSTLLPHAARVTAIERDQERLAGARAGFPQLDVQLLQEHLRLRVRADQVDLAFAPAAFPGLAGYERRRLIAELWRAVRPGGRLVFLETFVPAPGTEGLSVESFLRTVLDATGGGVVLDHVESLRRPGQEWWSQAVVSMVKVGVPATW